MRQPGPVARRDTGAHQRYLMMMEEVVQTHEQCSRRVSGSARGLSAAAAYGSRGTGEYIYGEAAHRAPGARPAALAQAVLAGGAIPPWPRIMSVGFPVIVLAHADVRVIPAVGSDGC